MESFKGISGHFGDMKKKIDRDMTGFLFLLWADQAGAALNVDEVKYWHKKELCFGLWITKHLLDGGPEFGAKALRKSWE